MRMLPVGSLAGLLKVERLNRLRVVAILTQVAEALDHAHANGVIHRDVKPSNVLLDDKDRVYVGDFGLAHLAEASIVLTETGMMAGTPQYMAPEQAKSMKVDRPADIYALGIVAYELLTGAVPFTGDTPIGVLMRHANEPLPIPPPDKVPEPLMQPVLKALAKDPADRWESAGAFTTALGLGVDEVANDSTVLISGLAPAVHGEVETAATTPAARTLVPPVARRSETPATLVRGTPPRGQGPVPDGADADQLGSSWRSGRRVAALAAVLFLGVIIVWVARLGLEQEPTPVDTVASLPTGVPPPSQDRADPSAANIDTAVPIGQPADATATDATPPSLEVSQTEPAAVDLAVPDPIEPPAATDGAEPAAAPESFPLISVDAASAVTVAGRSVGRVQAQEFEGTFLYSGPDGTIRLVLQQDTSGSVNGVMSDGVTVMQLDGAPEASGISGVWGIHLTGASARRAGNSPWSVRRRAFQAGWVPTGSRRRRWLHFGCGVNDEVSVAHRVVRDGELEHPVEHHPAAAGAAAVEAEHELIQVAGQVGGVDRALVRAQQPPLDQ